MQIRWQCDSSRWQAILEQVPAATIFHSPAWAETYARSGRGHYEVMHAEWSDGRQAIVPVGVRPIWQSLLQAAAVGIDGGYGGILATGRLDPDEVTALMRCLQRRFPEWTLATNPFDPPAPGTLPLTLTPTNATLAVPLAPLSELRHHYDRERRRAVRRYEAEGVRTEVVRRPQERDLRQFWQLYRQAADHWRRVGRPGAWVRDERWFEALWHCAGEQLTVVTAWVGQELAGAEILACQGRIATELFSVWDRRFARQQVSTALTEACLVESFARGCRYLDGMPSGELDGVDRFKASFGAVAQPIWLAHRQHWLSRALQHGRKLRGWWRLPAPVPLAGVAMLDLVVLTHG
jgi:hypothetical protein